MTVSEAGADAAELPDDTAVASFAVHMPSMSARRRLPQFVLLTSDLMSATVEPGPCWRNGQAHRRTLLRTVSVLIGTPS